MVQKKQYSFLLSNINIDLLLSQNYGYQITNSVINVDDEDTSATQIPDIKKEVGHHFFDPQKNKVSFLLTMIDTTSTKILPERINKPCWWCGYEFSTSPLGIPLRYHTSHKNNPYVIEYENYMMKNYPTFYKKGELDFFETEGVFCSFPCCKAMILSEHSSYKKSITLLNLMYMKLCGSSDGTEKIIPIKKAGSWKLLEKWCGPLTIEEFRKSFDNLEYFQTSNVKKPFMFITHFYHEEIMK